MKRRRRRIKSETTDENSFDNFGLRLHELRCRRGTTQLSLAEQLGIGQTALSHMERRNDILLSTLRAYIEALGGRLHVAATFPDATPISLSGNGSWQPATDAVNVTGEYQLCLPSILGPEQFPPSRDVIFSVHPTHASKILDGTKTVELRRRFAGCVRRGTLALIYTTSPTSALTGFARILEVQRLAVRELWKRHRAAAGLRKGDFEAYFSGLERGYAIVLASAKPLSRPVGLPELRERFGFEPPQSYQYASPNMRGLIEYERS
jgi:predicted transcriptional regulator/transcriptional regulator with XRE-family HTH domain